MRLNKRQILFAKFYVECGFNASQAAIKAGYSTKDAGNQGYRLTKNVEVKKKLLII
jgi:phage terminase small subunit